jgi:hypothetical protein
MKSFSLLTAFAATAAFASIPTLTQAQIAPLAAPSETSVDRSFESSPKDCAAVKWSETALRAYPSIGAACQGVEQRNGKTYVKFEGDVEKVSKGGRQIRVDLQDGEDLIFTPTARTALYIDGKRTEFGKVKEGMSLNFYVPEDRLQAELQPDPNRLAFVIIPLHLSRSAAGGVASSESSDSRNQRLAANTNELPRTAGPLPLIGLAGAVLVAFGAGATLRRRWR